MIAEAKPVMSVREAAKYLGISEDSLYDYAAKGTVPAFKLGPRWKFSRVTLDRWMEFECSKIADHAKLRRREARDKEKNLELAFEASGGGAEVGDETQS